MPWKVQRRRSKDLHYYVVCMYDTRLSMLILFLFRYSVISSSFGRDIVDLEVKKSFQVPSMRPAVAILVLPYSTLQLNSMQRKEALIPELTVIMSLVGRLILLLLLLRTIRVVQGTPPNKLDNRWSTFLRGPLHDFGGVGTNSDGLTEARPGCRHTNSPESVDTPTRRAATRP